MQQYHTSKMMYAPVFYILSLHAALQDTFPIERLPQQAYRRLLRVADAVIVISFDAFPPPQSIKTLFGLQREQLITVRSDGYSNGHCVVGTWYNLVSVSQSKESYATGASNMSLPVLYCWVLTLLVSRRLKILKLVVVLACISGDQRVQS